MNAIVVLNDTLRVANHGDDTGTVKLRLTHDEMTQAEVFLPERVRALHDAPLPTLDRPRAGAMSVVNGDTFEVALRRRRQFPELFQGDAPNEPLVLNMANPIHPGGGVRIGARAQEEELCRRSTLLLSLESDAAQPYYAYNRGLPDDMLGSEAMILTPRVEVFRDTDWALTPETAIVAAQTCAAPIFRYGYYDMGEQGYWDMFQDRIVCLLKCAAHWGYRCLVLGAWGCGAFENDPQIVAGLFKKALDRPEGTLTLRDYFDRVDFAVLCRPNRTRNFDAFAAVFGGEG